MNQKTRCFICLFWGVIAASAPAQDEPLRQRIYGDVSEVVVFFEQGRTVFNTSITDDGSEHYFTDSNPDSRADGSPTALWVRTADGAKPVPTPGINIPADVHVTPDGQTLYFTEFGAEQSHILSMNSTSEGWSAPSRVTELAMENGATYVTSTRKGEMVFVSAGDIYLQSDGTAIRLPDTINSTAGEHDPFIAQDGSFLIFVRQQPEIGDSNMFISFRVPNGWTEAEKLPAPFNLDKVDGSPYVTPDREYLFFTSNRAGDGVTRTYQAPFEAWFRQAAPQDAPNSPR